MHSLWVGEVRVTQSTFEDFTSVPGFVSNQEKDEYRPVLAPDDPRSCPWCMAPPSMFRDSALGVGCSRCHAAIPVGVEWYENGEKRMSVQEAFHYAKMFKMHV